MPAGRSSAEARPVRLRLANGLRVALLPAPWLSRAAAAIRVEAGSHDAPSAYPGLAHFLEHLVFLGSAAFPAEEGLIPFVQAHGGQVNASTRERHTEFFFELAPTVFEQGLARLCDMLARPSLELSAQLREREVLHAEFLAWSRDAASTPARALAQALPIDHPLAGFHAGNRYSLPVRQPAFQQALRDFHRSYYQAEQASLVLLGPLSLAELRRLAEVQGARFCLAPPTPRCAPPSLLPLRTQRVALTQSQADLSLVFLLQWLPPAAREALEFLCCWLAEDSPGGWHGHLLDSGWSDALSVTQTYLHGGQATLQIDLQFGARGRCGESEVVALLFDWLRFFAAQDDWGELRDEYARLRTRQLEVMAPLALARHWLECSEQALGLSPAGLAALRAVLGQLRPERLVCIHGRQPDAVAVAPRSAARPHWRLPPPNPLLRESGARVPAARGGPAYASLQFSSELTTGAGQGALFLRWRARQAMSGRAALCQRLQAGLRPLLRAAGRAGVQLRFEQQGAAWELALSGLARVLPEVLGAALQRLAECPDAPGRRVRGAQPQGQMLLRQLLLRLDGALGAEAGGETGVVANLQQCAWDGLALGLDASQLAAVQQLLVAAPGQPGSAAPDARPPTAGYLWQDAAVRHPENALLLFCPLPEPSPASEALWRLLAQLCQTPFFHRCRNELQLGYGVFSGFRQLADRGGLLFGVQSPHAPAGEILQHIEAFLADQQERLATRDDRELALERTRLAAQLDAGAMEFSAAAAQLWQAHKAGHAHGLQGLRSALAGLGRESLLDGLQALRQAAGGWFCLANAGRPDPRWQTIAAPPRT